MEAIYYKTIEMSSTKGTICHNEGKKDIHKNKTIVRMGADFNKIFLSVLQKIKHRQKSDFLSGHLFKLKKHDPFPEKNRVKMVRGAGLEPAHLTA